MKKFTVKNSIVLFLLSVSLPLFVYADSGTNEGNKDITKDDIPLGRTNSKRPNGPRMPSNQQLWFSYDSAAQQCEVTMGADTVWMSVTVEQLPVGFYYVVG